MGLTDTGSLSTTDSLRVSVTPIRSASSNIVTPTDAAVTSATETGINRDIDNVRETSHKCGSVRPKELCLRYF